MERVTITTVVQCQRRENKTKQNKTKQNKEKIYQLLNRMIVLKILALEINTSNKKEHNKSNDFNCSITFKDIMR